VIHHKRVADQPRAKNAEVKSKKTKRDCSAVNRLIWASRLDPCDLEREMCCRREKRKKMLNARTVLRANRGGDDTTND
jgi:hypothetical protein